MKRFLSVVLSLVMIFSLSSPAFATAADANPNIIGTVYWENSVGSDSSRDADSSKQVKAIASYTKNSDGSYTTYQYMNGVLTDEHTTIPGSGIVYHTYYDADGTISKTTENVALDQNIPMSDASSRGAPTSVSIRDMGYMHYIHPWTDTRYSIFVKIQDEYYGEEDTEFTFRQGTARTLAEWTNTLLSVWSFETDPVTIISFAIGFLSATGVLVEILDGVYSVVITKTIPCTYNNQKFFGTATAPSTNYPEGYLQGTYAVIRNGNQSKSITEGYTVRSWGTNTFGRMMMYQVFGIDEAPTSWTNLDKSIP